VDYSQEFGPSNRLLWDAEYEANVKATSWLTGTKSEDSLKTSVISDFSKVALPYDLIGELENMEPAERQFVLDELSDRPDLWDQDEEVMFI
jgi:hypothetical protein